MPPLVPFLLSYLFSTYVFLLVRLKFPQSERKGLLAVKGGFSLKLVASPSRWKGTGEERRGGRGYSFGRILQPHRSLHLKHLVIVLLRSIRRTSKRNHLILV